MDSGKRLVMVIARRVVQLETVVDPDWVPVLTTAPLELVLVEPMPDVCSEHGLPAVSRRSFVVNSCGPGSERPTIREFFRYVPLPWRDPVAFVPEARLRFECPACVYCAYEVRRFRRIALSALVIVVLGFVALAVAIVARVEWLYIPLGFLAVPGCFPIAMIAGMLAWSKSGFFADVWLNDSTTHLVVSAHPDFVANVAVGERDSGGQSH
ncbi:hypothetical protein ACFWU5_05110 [Nocardia sp. NPDC058640]|uniref:hypothetical protein n=1 Tax=Nocardia sp. NPDC058640 TaxID=3346571 RepID=UPI00365FD038